MKLEDYIQLAMRTEANQEKIRHRVYELGTRATRLDNACRGLVNDAAEVNNVIQVWLEYGKPLDQTHLMEELGDVMWRLAQICSEMNWTFEEVQQANIRKLQARYPEKYSDAQADPDKRDRIAEKEAVATVKPSKNPSNEINEMDVREQTGQGWAEPVIESDDSSDPIIIATIPTPTVERDGFAVAREIVRGYLDGKAADLALRSIETAEKKFKGE